MATTAPRCRHRYSADMAGGRLLVVAVLAALCAGGGAQATARVELVVAVTGVEVRFPSAAVSWQVSAPATVRIEYGLGEDYGVWSRPTRARQAGQGRTLVAGLEPLATYRFRVTARAGRQQAQATGSFTTGPTLPWTTATTTRNALFLDWQPFFPRMVWRQCPWAYPQSLAAGVNLFMGTGCGDEQAQLDALAGRAYSVLDATRPIDGRGVVGYHLLDEADIRVPGPDSLPRLPPSKESRRVTFLTLSGHFFSWAAPPEQGRGIYPGLIDRAEMVGFDLYPLQSWCRKDALPAVYDAQRELVRLAAGKPTFQWIEAGQMEFCQGLEPSPAIVRAETWLAIAGGARGVGWFPSYWKPEVAAEIGRLSREIASLAPALLGPEVPVVVDGESPVKAGARSYNGATYVIAANASFSHVAARIRVPNLRPGRVRVFGEGRTVPVVKGTITDSFRGLAARVYIAPPAGA
ncbi:MAG: hypothetical protein C4299_02435 [Thermoleophilia bacterium]